MTSSKLSKTKLLQKEILSEIEEHLSNDILLNDIKSFLNELNWWKITTLKHNLESFLGYIDDIISGFDEEISYSQLIGNNNNLNNTNNEKTSKKDFFDIKDEDYINKVNKLRGLFWLTVTEFTQGRNSNLVLKYRELIDKSI